MLKINMGKNDGKIEQKNEKPAKTLSFLIKTARY